MFTNIYISWFLASFDTRDILAEINTYRVGDNFSFTSSSLVYYSRFFLLWYF